MRVKTFVTLVAVGLVSVSATGSGRAASHKGFSLSSLKGSYAAIFSGKLLISGELLPFLGTGVFISDGNGNLTGHETYTLDNIVCEATIKGTYTVNPDGTGTNDVDFMPTPGESSQCMGGHYSQSLVIADSGELVFLSNTNGDQLNEQWHLQK